MTKSLLRNLLVPAAALGLMAVTANAQGVDFSKIEIKVNKVSNNF